MTPDADQILRISAGQLMAQVMPQLGPGYGQGTTALIAILMNFAAHEFEHGAEIRAKENADMRALFAELTPLVVDNELRSQLETASGTPEGSLAISALNESNAALRRLLIALQIHVEEAGKRVSQRRIWSVLKAMAARRIIPFPSR